MPSQPNLQLTTLSVTSPQTRNHLTIFQLLSVVCQRYPEKALTIWRCIFTGNALPNTQPYSVKTVTVLVPEIVLVLEPGLEKSLVALAVLCTKPALAGMALHSHTSLCACQL